MAVNSYVGANERYAGDFAWLIELFPLVAIFSTARLPKKLYAPIYVAFTVSTVFGFTICFFSSFEGIENTLRFYHPDIYMAARLLFN